MTDAITVDEIVEKIYKERHVGCSRMPEAVEAPERNKIREVVQRTLTLASESLDQTFESLRISLVFHAAEAEMSGEIAMHDVFQEALTALDVVRHLVERARAVASKVVMP